MSTTSTYVLRGACECGTCVVETKAIPKVRFICHCTICQAFSRSAYSDVMIVPAFRAAITGARSIVYKKHKRFRFPPPNLGRGHCKTCDFPFIETWGVGSLNVLLFIRAASCGQRELLPASQVHVFYEHRVADMDDGLPKHEGYLGSQLAIAKSIVRAF